MHATHNSVPILSAIKVTQLWTICAGFSLQSFWLCALDAYLRLWYFNYGGTPLINTYTKTNTKTNTRQIFWWKIGDYRDTHHLIEAVHWGGDQALGKRVAVIRTEDTFFLARVVAEAPEKWPW